MFIIILTIKLQLSKETQTDEGTHKKRDWGTLIEWVDVRERNKTEKVEKGEHREKDT